VGEPLAPPTVGHHLVEEAPAVVEVRQLGAPQRRLGPVQAQPLAVSQAPHGDEAGGRRALVTGRGEGKAELFHAGER
jgi:hypothetical protein